MGLMFYAELGRTGVYHVQELLHMMDVNASNPFDVSFTRSFVGHALPSSNWLRANPWRWNDFNTSLDTSPDSQIVDLLLPYRDVAYRIDQVFDMMEHSGLRVLQLLQPAIYDPESYVRDPKILSRIPKDKKSRALFSELLSGNIYHHFLYVGKKDIQTNGAVSLQDEEGLEHAVVVAHMFDPVELARNLDLWNMKYLPWKHRNLGFKLPIPDQSRRILELIDGSRTLKEIYDLLDDLDDVESFQDFVRGPFRILYKSLNGINKLYLTWTHAPVCSSAWCSSAWCSSAKRENIHFLFTYSEYPLVSLTLSLINSYPCHVLVLPSLNECYTKNLTTQVQKRMALDHNAELFPRHSYHAPASCGD